MKQWIAAILLMTGFNLGFAEIEEDFVPIERITKWKGDSYSGPIDLDFDIESGVIHAKLETENLILVSLQEEHLEHYIKLFTDPAAMVKYCGGTPWTEECIEKEIDTWISRWEKNRDPFSAFAIFEKKAGTPFVGHIVLGHGSKYGQAELAFLLKSSCRNLPYATQAVTAILKSYVSHLIQEKSLVNRNESGVDPSPLRSIHGTSHYDDTFSGQAMIRSGMEIIAEEDVFWGEQRFHYLIRVNDILNPAN